MPTISNISHTDVTICGGSDGTITITASGVNPLSYSINGGTTYVQNGGTFTGLSQGNYPIAVMDNNGCIANGPTISISNGSAPPAPTAGNNQIFCQGVTAANLAATAVFGGTLTWYNDPGLTNIVGTGTTFNPNSYLTVGINNFYVTETVSGCESPSSTVTITVNSLPNISVSSNSPVCGNETLSLNATGGTTYQWSGPSGFTSNNQNPTITNPNGTNAGTYYVTVTDGNGCLSIGQTTVIVNSVPELTVTSNSPLCSGQDIHLTSSNAVSWSWNGPNSWTSNVQNPTLPNAQTAQSGTYSVTITDSNGCMNSGSVNVTVNETPTVNAGSDQTILYGTSTSLSGLGSGGSGNYSYNWQPSDSLVNATVQNPTTVNLEATTTFVLMVTDNTTGCKGYDTTIVTVQGGPLSVVVNVNDHTICSGETIQLQATASGGSGSYTYNWSSNPAGFTSNLANPTDNPTQTTTYYVTVDDGFNSVSGSVQVVVNPLPNVTANATSTAICEGSQVTLNGGGAMNYVWDNGVTNGTPFTPLSTTTYTVTGTDANGCSNTAQVSVTVNPLPIVTANATMTTVCLGSAVTLFGTGSATNYVWDNGATDNVPLNISTTTTYTVTGTDANGCTSTDQITIYVNPTYLYTETQTICNGSGYTWHGNTYTTSGTYYDSLTTHNGCDSVYVLNLSISQSYLFTENFTICQGQQYSWHGNVYGTAGAYYDSLLTAGGCDSVYVLNLTVNPSYIFNEVQTICDGSSIVWHGQALSTAGTYYDSLTTSLGCDSIFALQLYVNPTYTTNLSYTICEGSTYTWYNQTLNASGTYYHTLTSMSGCDSTLVLTLTVQPLPTVNIQASQQAICDGGSVVLTATGADSYVWSTNESTTSITVSPNTTTIYSVTGTTNGCGDTAMITITVNPLPQITITSSTTNLCPGSTTTLTAQGGQTYLWSNSSTTNPITVSPTITTTYSVTGTDANSCSSVATVTITTLPTYNLSQTASICQGDVYAWNGNNYASSGTYTLNLTTQQGCDSTLSLQLTVHPKPSVTINAIDTTLIIGNSITLNADGADTYQWNPTTALSCSDCATPVASPEATISYCVIGSNVFNCTDTSCIMIHVDSECGELFIPLAFSPNGDSKNDVWKVQGRCVKDFEVKVFDRWGEMVYESINQNEGWDGNFRGKAVDSDVYVYILNLTMRDGETKTLKGDITLLR